MKIVSINPANDEVLGQIEESTKEEVLEKVELAQTVKAEWGNLNVKKRMNFLKEIYKEVESNSEKLANLVCLEQGRPIVNSEKHVVAVLKEIEWNFEHVEELIKPEITYEDDKEIHKVFYEPRGVVSIISPFNSPLVECLVPAMQNLLVGNVVISKPDPNLPLIHKALEDIVIKSDLPKGVWQFVFGGQETGGFLVEQNIDMINFTGSTKTGQYLYKVAANKMIPIHMELGGSDPGIVCEDADIDAVIQKIFYYKFSNCGQVCCALKRLIVHEKVFDEVVSKLKDIVEAQTIGDPFDRNTYIGPLVSKKQLDCLLEQFQDAVNRGATVICGGKRLKSKGNFFEPTLLKDITKDMRVWKEEVFGPLLPIISFKTIEEAIELANDTLYGLGGYVFTTNKETYEKISKNLQSGMVRCNNLTYKTPFNPFGGIKKSGLGRNGGRWGLQELCNIKIIVYEK